MPAATGAPPWITGGRDSIAVRISAHPVVAALCEQFGGALVSTSANLGGEPPAYARAGLDPRLLDAIDGIVAGESAAGPDGGRPILATAAGEHLSTTYLLYGGKRAAVDLRDLAVVRALRLDGVTPRQVSRSFLDLLPELPAITAPPIA